MWTLFWDMCSGGSQKESFGLCFIEAPLDEATVVFYKRFGHNPERITCTCCGEDYSISEGESLEELSGFHRGCVYSNKRKRWLERGEQDTDGPLRGTGDYRTVAEFEAEDDVEIIRAAGILPEERTGEVPEQGYIWKD